ncbi:toxin-antitoxin system YwqK family antitoxin [Fluviicola sp.]|uniref:toxin-antitoxin system YwqK family antitoxin n=1 Tax=Fluviicola sp. TaxID=1917219 RepID=UPI003D2E8BD0
MKNVLIILMGLFLFSCNEGLDEHLEYYPSGKIKAKMLIDKQNLAQGLAYEYYENGNLKFKRTNLNGKSNGLHEEYYPNGKLKTKGHFLNDVEIDSTHFYFKSGKLESIIIHDRKGRILKELFYYTNGKIKEERALLVDKGEYVSGREYTEAGKIIEDFSEGSYVYANLRHSKNSNGNLLLKIDLKNNPYTDSIKILIVKNFDFDIFSDPEIIRKVSYSGANKLAIEILNSDYVGDKLNLYIETSKYKDNEKRHRLSKNYYIQLPKKGQIPKDNIHGIYPN